MNHIVFERVYLGIGKRGWEYKTNNFRIEVWQDNAWWVYRVFIDGDVSTSGWGFAGQVKASLSVFGTVVGIDHIDFVL